LLKPLLILLLPLMLVLPPLPPLILEGVGIILEAMEWVGLVPLVARVRAEREMPLVLLGLVTENERVA
jgi:hypothetical protein